jgi:hypothetical protein
MLFILFKLFLIGIIEGKIAFFFIFLTLHYIYTKKYTINLIEIGFNFLQIWQENSFCELLMKFTQKSVDK